MASRQWAQMPNRREQMTQTRVMIVEDQTVFRQMLAELLQQESGITVVAELSHGQTALEAGESLKPDMAIVDLVLPDISGLDVVQALRRRRRRIQLLVITAQNTVNALMEAFRAGPNGIVTKTASLDELREAVRRVAAGGTYYCAKTSDVLREHSHRHTPVTLSARERQIVRLVAMGKSSKEIASELDIAAKTVANHRLRITRKLAITDIAGLTRYAIRQGWIDDDA